MKNSHLWEQPSTEGRSWWINAPAPYSEVEVFLRCMLYTVVQSSPQIRFYLPVVPTCLITPLISTFPTPLLVLSAITSQIKYFHSYLCL